ncbi:MAG: hypothetical protein LLG37_06895 [Spirochaetia bacterium]|nr:hypothetical protein [Spirochaetia bacterium]
MSEHGTAAAVEKNMTAVNPMRFCAELTRIQNAYDLDKKQVKYFINGREAARGIMALMVDLSSVNGIFSLRVAVSSGPGHEDTDHEEALKIMDKISKI